MRITATLTDDAGRALRTVDLLLPDGYDPAGAAAQVANALEREFVIERGPPLDIDALNRMNRVAKR